MVIRKRYFCSRSLRLVLVAMLGFLYGFSPSRLPVTDGMYWVELGDDSDSQREAVIKVHSVVKQNWKELDEASAWVLAKTIADDARKYALDPMLVLAVIKVESRFQHQATSIRGARGLMQILPFVGNDLATRAELIDDWDGEDSLDDPILNVKLGIFYLGALKKRFENLELALTAYNWGPTRVQSQLEEDGPISFGYAERVLSSYRELRRRFGMEERS